jgi:glycosyltransferase involved in cell wall biosynthesis
VMFVIDTTDYGGAEAYVVHLLRHLPDRFVRTLAAAPPIPERIVATATSLGIPIVTVDPARTKFDLGRLAHQLKAVLATRPDLVHVNLTTAANSRHLLGALAASRTPSIATLHIVAPIGSRVQRTILRAAYRRLTRAIAVSEETRQQLCDELRVPERAVRVIANGVEKRDVAARDARNPVRIGGLGRLTRQKGFDLLIEAVRRLDSDGEPVIAVIGGAGIEREALQMQAAGLPIELVGLVDDTRSFFDELDVFCLPSRWEGLPFALLEAMMAGLPCVAADVGDVARALGDAGVLVPLEDVDALAGALRRLVASPAERLRLGAAAHERAKAHFSVEKMVEQTVRVYSEALAR